MDNLYFDDDLEEDFEQIATKPLESAKSLIDSFAELSDDEVEKRAEAFCERPEAVLTELFPKPKNTLSEVKKAPKPTRKVAQMPAPVEFEVTDDFESDPKKSMRNYCAIAVRMPYKDQSGQDVVVTKLPFHNDDQFISSDAIARSCLFGLGAYRKVNGVLERVMYSGRSPRICGEYSSIRIFYIGEALDEGDYDVWMTLMAMCKDNLSERKIYTRYAIVKELGRSQSSKSYETLRLSIERLHTGKFRIESEGKFIGVEYESFIKELGVDRETGESYFQLNEKMASLFSTQSSMCWTRIQRKDRILLNGKCLALWLYSFYSSHRGNFFPFTIKKIEELCGFNGESSDFKKSLYNKKGDTETGALVELSKIGFLKAYSLYKNSAGELSLKIEKA